MTQEGHIRMCYYLYRYGASAPPLYYRCCFLCILHRMSGPCSGLLGLPWRQGQRRMDRLNASDCSDVRWTIPASKWSTGEIQFSTVQALE